MNRADFIRWMPLILEALRTLGGSAKPREVYEWIAQKVNLPQEERWRRNKGGPVRFQNQVQWGRQYLMWEGFIDGAQRGLWTLTPKGAKAALTEDESQVLVQKWGKQVKTRHTANPPAPVLEPDESTQELFGEPPAITEEIEEDNLLAVLHSLPPTGFERLCKRLLHEHGFEGVEVTGRSHDGGIDGGAVLRLNPFYTLKVLFQCKRYKGAVSRSEIGDFRNAVLGRADKGVFITTGHFSADAEREAKREGVPPIELVDGDRLVELFESKQLGLRRREVFDIDQSFFDQYR